MTRVLMTGIGGFIGHHVAEFILQETDWDIIGIDSFHSHHKGDLARLSAELLAASRIGRLKLLKHDLTIPFSSALVNQILNCRLEGSKTTQEEIDYVINLASDSHVTRSIHHPLTCWHNNTALVGNMLELAREISPKKFIQISTDEVYGDVDYGAPAHPEWDAILPSNPYSASKAAQEALAIAYWRTYELPIVITNTMNVIGERQGAEKFVPKVIGSVLTEKVVSIHADGLDRVATRVWLDARNMASALVHLLSNVPVSKYDGGHGPDRPDRYNIVGATERNVLGVAHDIALILDRKLKYQLVRGDKERPGYDRRYALDGSKLAATGWVEPWTYEETLRRVVTWSQEHPEWIFDEAGRAA